MMTIGEERDFGDFKTIQMLSREELVCEMLIT